MQAVYCMAVDSHGARGYRGGVQEGQPFLPPSLTLRQRVLHQLRWKKSSVKGVGLEDSSPQVRGTSFHNFRPAVSSNPMQKAIPIRIPIQDNILCPDDTTVRSPLWSYPQPHLHPSTNSDSKYASGAECEVPRISSGVEGREARKGSGGAHRVRRLRSISVLTGFQEDWLELAPAALRLWDKVHSTPRDRLKYYSVV